jgi:hypothetical protein
VAVFFGGVAAEVVPVEVPFDASSFATGACSSDAGAEASTAGATCAPFGETFGDTFAKFDLRQASNDREVAATLPPRIAAT